MAHAGDGSDGEFSAARGRRTPARGVPARADDERVDGKHCLSHRAAGQGKHYDRRAPVRSGDDELLVYSLFDFFCCPSFQVFFMWEEEREGGRGEWPAHNGSSQFQNLLLKGSERGREKERHVCT